MSTMQHYTVDTGHCRDSHENEVGEGVIAAILPLLRDGLHDLPGFDGYTLRVTVADSTIAATVYSSRWQWRWQKGGDPAPLVTTFVCLDDDGLRGTLRATGA